MEKIDKYTHEKKKSILFLHGKTQNSIIFEKRMKKFIKIFSKDYPDYQIIIPNGPYFMDESDDEKIEEEKNRRWVYSTLNELKEKTEMEYKGFEKSLEILLDIVEKNRVEIIFGFSQGSLIAIFLSILFSSNEVFKKKFIDLKCIILCAGFIEPIPLNEEFKDRYELIKDLLCNKKDRTDAFIKVPILNIYGETDVFIVKEKSQNLEKLFTNIESYSHPGKHFVPLSKQDIKKYIDFIKKNI
jgi:predicted esterase